LITSIRIENISFDQIHQQTNHQEIYLSH